PLRNENFAEKEMNTSSLRIQVQRFLQFGTSFVVSARHVQHVSKAQAKIRAQRIERDCLFLELDCLFEIAHVSGYIRTKTKDLRVARLEDSSFGKAGIGGIPIPVVKNLRSSECQITGGRVRIERNCSLRIVAGLSKAFCDIGQADLCHPVLHGGSQSPCWCVRPVQIDSCVGVSERFTKVFFAGPSPHEVSSLQVRLICLRIGTGKSRGNRLPIASQQLQLQCRGRSSSYFILNSKDVIDSPIVGL